LTGLEPFIISPVQPALFQNKNQHKKRVPFLIPRSLTKTYEH
jgi:hypothetical protein